MKIQGMFKDNIDRRINGVVKVDQDESSVLVQEVSEYVVTKELKKHFITFFDNYVKAFEENTADTGVWISGFFGSGKSHFLKMLSYLLENKEIQGVKTVERFREKFDDPASFMAVDRAARGQNDTILFNIDVEGPSNKDKTAVLRVFVKMFYKYLGYYGENLKVAKLEQYIAKKGKTEQFRRVFEEINGAPWLESRDTYNFFEDDMVAVLREVLGMSEQAARNWFNGSEDVETSIAQLAAEIKEYVESQPPDFRLLFMIDEVGQYVGGDTDLLLNLQSLVEKIGSECHGQVWVVCTGQEAIDEIIKARENEFSRIQARFHTRLSLSSSSADEVIQKRILLKTDEAERSLEQLYNANDSVLRNLFSFSNAVRDIKGYSDASEFAGDFPFVPYQFILLQKVFAEIRKHGNSGKHLSGGERSMLSGFQEAAQKIEDKDEYALAPFYLFYDTVHGFLDSSIQRVIVRCERAAAAGSGIEPQDADVLKLLYLVRYLDDVKATLDNIVILMADDIRMDKINKREEVQGSLERLLGQNYIGCTGEIYNFLTDEEQDVQREIKNTPVSAADIADTINKIIFGDIYDKSKVRCSEGEGRYDFAFSRQIDGQFFGTQNADLKLRILTAAADPGDKDDMYLAAESSGKAVAVLAERPYYDYLENAMKIRRYVRQRNVKELPESLQSIIRGQQLKADRFEKLASEELAKAIVEARFYVNGDRLEIRNGDAKSKLEQALEYLAGSMYSKLSLIAKFAESDEDIGRILKGEEAYLKGLEPNRGAADEIEKHLEICFKQKRPVTMSDLLEKFQGIPFGWKDIDIAAVTAMLIKEQKVTVKYGGAAVRSDDPQLPELLRKKNRIAGTSICRRQTVAAEAIRSARAFLRDFFHEMDVPEDEDGLVRHIATKFDEELERCRKLEGRCAGNRYPGQKEIGRAVGAVNNVLSQKNDNTALIQRLLACQDELCDARDGLQEVEDFFRTRAGLFDQAVQYARVLSSDGEYIAKDADAGQALEQIRRITHVEADGSFRYDRIPELHGLMDRLKASHGRMLEHKRGELSEIVRQCLDDLKAKAGDNPDAEALCGEAAAYFAGKEEQISSCAALTLLDGLAQQIWKYKDGAEKRIQTALQPQARTAAGQPAELPAAEDGASAAPREESVRSVYRQNVFPAGTLRSEGEIDAYVESVRDKLKTLLRDSGSGIEIR